MDKLSLAATAREQSRKAADNDSGRAATTAPLMSTQKGCIVATNVRSCQPETSE